MQTGEYQQKIATTGRSRKCTAALLITGVQLLCTGLFFCIEKLLPQGYYYRSGFSFWMSGLLLIAWLLIFFYWTMCLMRIISGNAGIPVLGKTILCILLVCLWAAACGICLLFDLIYISRIDTEENQRHGLIYIRHDVWLDSPRFYYQKAVGPLLRRELSEEEKRQYKIESGKGTDNVTGGRADEEGIYSAADNMDNTDTPDTKDFGEESLYAEELQQEERLSAEIQAVYTFLSEAGEISEPIAEQPTVCYSAKGTPYAVFEEDRADDFERQKRLVYDRISKNGKCTLFVYYQDLTGGETEILGFYAVDQETLEVIPGEKTTWSDAGSEHYREVTGE